MPGVTVSLSMLCSISLLHVKQSGWFDGNVSGSKRPGNERPPKPTRDFTCENASIFVRPINRPQSMPG